METRTKNQINRPSPRLTHAVEMMIPYTFRTQDIGDLTGRYESDGQFLLDGVAMSLTRFASQFPRVFDIRIMLAEAVAFWLAFAATPAARPPVPVLLLMLFSLRARDAYVFPANRSFTESTLDAIIAAAVLAVSQLWSHDASALGSIATALLMISGIHMATPPKNRGLGPRRHSYAITRLLNTVWLAAAVFTLMKLVFMTPIFFPLQRHLMIISSILLFALAFRLEKGDLEGLTTTGESLLNQKLEGLWYGPTSFAEIAAISVLGIPLAVGFATGANGPEPLAVVVGLAGIWNVIRRVNRDTASYLATTAANAGGNVKA